jgi:hypothetical protein
MRSAPSSSQPLYRQMSSNWLPGYCTCPPREEASSDLLPPPANPCTEGRAAIGYLDIVLVRQGKKPHQTKSSYWLPGYRTCPPREEASSDKEQLMAIIGYRTCLPREEASSDKEQLLAIRYLDIILVRQWEKSHEICFLLKPTVVEEEEQVSTNLQTHILHSRFEKMFKIMIKKFNLKIISKTVRKTSTLVF